MKKHPLPIDNHDDDHEYANEDDDDDDGGLGERRMTERRVADRRVGSGLAFAAAAAAAATAGENGMEKEEEEEERADERQALMDGRYTSITPPTSDVYSFTFMDATQIVGAEDDDDYAQMAKLGIQLTSGCIH